MKKTRNFIFSAMLIAGLAFITGCAKDADNNMNNNNGNNDTPQYTEPTLPASVGEDPFKGNTYQGGTDNNIKYIFNDDGTLTKYFYNDGFGAHTLNNYTYDEEKSILSMCAKKMNWYSLLTFPYVINQEKFLDYDEIYKKTESLTYEDFILLVDEVLADYKDKETYKEITKEEFTEFKGFMKEKIEESFRDVKTFMTAINGNELIMLPQEDSKKISIEEIKENKEKKYEEYYFTKTNE